MKLVFNSGILAFITGAILRLSASALSWPLEYSYSGDRAETIWAIREKAIDDISIMIMIFGVLLVLIAAVRYLWPDDKVSEKDKDTQCT